MAVVSDPKVRLPVVVEIATAGGLRPAGAQEAGLLTHFGKVTLAVIAVELRACWRGIGVECGSIRDENVVGPVPFVVQDGRPPVPVLSRMKSFLSLPPKVLAMVKPDWAAMSMKWGAPLSAKRDRTGRTAPASRPAIRNAQLFRPRSRALISRGKSPGRLNAALPEH